MKNAWGTLSKDKIVITKLYIESYTNFVGKYICMCIDYKQIIRKIIIDVLDIHFHIFPVIISRA